VVTPPNLVDVVGGVTCTQYGTLLNVWKHTCRQEKK
jgi:hypothetical protein